MGRKCQRKNGSEIVAHVFIIQTESKENRTWNPGNELNGDPLQDGTVSSLGFATVDVRENMIPERTPRNTRLLKDLPINTRQVYGEINGEIRKEGRNSTIL